MSTKDGRPVELVQAAIWMGIGTGIGLFVAEILVGIIQRGG